MAWDEVAVTILKTMWADGHSASKIASALPMKVTRNAVIGKANRLKLDKRKHSGGLGRASARPLSPRVADKPSRHHRPARTRVAPLKVDTVQIIDNAIPVAQRRTLDTRQNNECHYPVNEPGTPEFFYCGAPVLEHDDHRPYCLGHRQRMYTAPRPRGTPRVGKPFKPLASYRV